VERPTQPLWTEPGDAAAAEPEPASAAATGRDRHRLTPVLAGLIGITLGAALGVPVGLAHQSPKQDVPTVTTLPAPRTPATTGGGLSTDDVAAQVDRSIVDITSRLGYQSATAAGTGMVLTPDGDVLTNNHVIEGATSITATSVTTGAKYTATVVGTDPSEDIAVIRLQRASNLTPITPGDSSAVAVGDPVVALGNAGGVGGTPAVAPGYITALDQQITASDSGGRNPQHLTGLIETDAAIRPGDSGGPLANAKAQVIGMDTAASISGFGANSTTDRGFAIPIRHALEIAHLIEAGKGSSTIHIGPRGMIGVQVSALSAATQGAVVEAVTDGSPADQAGIVVGDTITAVDNDPVTTSDSLGKLIKAHGAGDRVTVAWTSGDGTRHTARVTLAAGPPD
jgi:S1-C subfamily serine protease